MIRQQIDFEPCQEKIKIYIFYNKLSLSYS